MDEPILELKDICYSYHSLKGETPALSHISFRVKKGEFLVIAGPSGCGKSTLLSMIAGLLAPEEGEILFPQGKPQLGYMLQHDHLFEWRSIYQNVILGLEINRQMTQAKLEQATRLLKDYGLYRFKDKKPSELSGGMKKRVGLARALAMQPQMVFYDEPTSGLDPVMTMTISRLIRKTQQTLGVTSVLVTHDMESAYYAADRIAMLYNGRIVQIGTVAEIKNSTNPIVKAFINGTELKEEEKDEQQ